MEGQEGIQHTPLYGNGEQSGTMCRNSRIYRELKETPPTPSLPDNHIKRNAGYYDTLGHHFNCGCSICLERFGGKDL